VKVANLSVLDRPPRGGLSFRAKINVQRRAALGQSASFHHSLAAVARASEGGARSRTGREAADAANEQRAAGQEGLEMKLADLRVPDQRWGLFGDSL